MRRLQYISKVFNDQEHLQVIKDISLAVSPGEFVSIVGPSGCGKTTLLNIIGSLETAYRGKVTFKNPNPRISFLFQRPALLKWRTVSQNISLPSELLGLPIRSIKRLLETVGLSDFAEYTPNQLSGGMRQRVALARSLANNPEILLMDEPFSSIDDLSREQLGLELQRIWHQHQKTILFVTHNIEEAVFLSDRVVVLSERPAIVKKIVPILLSRPRNLDIKHTKKFQEHIKQIKKILKK